jgi:hypothetical protein
MYDQSFVQFRGTPEFPVPPPQLLFHGFHQAVFSNVKGARKMQVYCTMYIDHSKGDRSISVLEKGEGKSYLDALMQNKVIEVENGNMNKAEVSHEAGNVSALGTSLRGCSCLWMRRDHPRCLTWH